jgi:hypothetical protein
VENQSATQHQINELIHEPRFVHSCQGEITGCSTGHSHPTTTPHLDACGLIPNLHRPYYYYFVLFKGSLLEERAWGQLARTPFA